MAQLETEMCENEKLMEELTEQLKKLEEQAGEIMQTYQQAEVLPSRPLSLSDGEHVKTPGADF